MQASRANVIRPSINDSYVCLNCRRSVQSQSNTSPERGLRQRTHPQTPSKTSLRSVRAWHVRTETSSWAHHSTESTFHIQRTPGQSEWRYRNGNVGNEGRIHNVESLHTTHADSSDAQSPYYNESTSPRRAASYPLRSVRKRASSISSTPQRYQKQLRAFHSSPKRTQESVPSPTETYNVTDAPNVLQSAIKSGKVRNIRAHLREWQKEHGQNNPLDVELPPDDIQVDEPINDFSRLNDTKMLERIDQEEEETFSSFSDDQRGGFDGTSQDYTRFLRMGDLVELDFASSEKQSLIAVFVRRFSNYSQLYTITGRWIHVNEKSIPYSIPRWVSPELVKPLLRHLPVLDTQTNMDHLAEQEYMEDLSVPREFAAPLVERMVQFSSESREIYRQNANALDNAHDLLAHPKDLRYGSLNSVAATLLKDRYPKLPVTALFTVRKAISNGGFAFAIDRRSHRLTGFVQIRSKEQVRTMEKVRSWLRAWQDDLAAVASMPASQRAGRRIAKETKAIYTFIGKAREIIRKSRKTRQPTDVGNVGPSSVRLPITSDSDCVRVEKTPLFSQEEAELVRFMEAWACSQLFTGIPRLMSLPPLLLHAIGMYEDLPLNQSTGFMFLQEIGTIMPYENRIRFDPHLLLPSSRHSKPLESLYSNIMEMRKQHDLVDSMADLRHDWKDLPVYCIDAEDAQEIDDGVSLERAGKDSAGRDTYWVHVHVANPTAFFSRDHAFANMARHLGETVYMPEKTHMMLPAWATRRFFSLAADRPCLTFSTLLNDSGEVLQRTVRNGIVRNVISISPDDIHSVLQNQAKTDRTELILTVGGDPPPRPTREPTALSSESVADLQILEKLAFHRVEHRRNAGGIFFEQERADVQVWQNATKPGLAWEPSFLTGSRIVEGDPVIQFRTKGYANWFTATTGSSSVLVREMMLLACETSAAWCAERHIPSIFRGTIPNPNAMDPDVYLRDILKPNLLEGGGYPMHLGLDYLRTMGSAVLRTHPRTHRYLGLHNYSKATSPLRRYGDMIVHWQIEAALRQEAKTGTSLVIPEPFVPQPSKAAPDRSFLPFSAPLLDNVMLGLQPREFMVSRAKSYSATFWQTMLLFRKFHFNDGDPLPFDTCRCFVFTSPETSRVRNEVGVLMEELNLSVAMERPDLCGLDRAMQGDVWECRIVKISMYFRKILVKPLRLVERVR